MVVAKIVAVLAVIIGLLRLRVPIGAAMLAGAVVVGALFADGPGPFAGAFSRAAVDLKTLDLLLVMALILILSHLLQQTGQFQRMMDSFGGVIRNNKVRMASMPTLIGLLPMLGGAYLSAPMVEAASQGLGLSSRRMALINYWFRHIWEYSWPLYPGILLASKYAGNGVAGMTFAQFPLTLVAVAVGIVFVLPRRLPAYPVSVSNASRPAAGRDFLINILPIIAVIALFVAVGQAGAAANLRFPLPNLPMMVGLVAACGVVMAQNRIGLGPVVNYAFRWSELAKMLFMVLSLMIFAGVFKELGATEALSDSMGRMGIPTIVPIMVLPFAAGLLSGVSVVFVSLSFPLVVGLIPAAASHLPYLVLAFSFGYLGVLLSPTHLCLILTKEYFRTDFKSIYRRLIFVSVIPTAAGVGLFLIMSK